MDSPPRIQVLSDHVANKIAAGEVVERPASVAKELIENAVDAGASRIEVEVVDGGRHSLSVMDDGSGMDRDNALLAIERHATSKIRDVDDIEHISTMGFRGEALPAIASVSRFTLATRRPEDLAGTAIDISGGKILSVADAGTPPGTVIRVRNLFFNVPARRKFLRAAATELVHIRQVFLVYALAHPSIAMRLVVDGREVHNLPAGGTLEDRLRELYSPDLFRSLRPLKGAAPGLSIGGLAGMPPLSRADRSDVYIFVNRRPASAATIYSALNEAYAGHLPKGRHPVLFLFIEVDPDAVDVNVHPTKREVRFREPAPLRNLLLDTLEKTLRGGTGTAAQAPASQVQASFRQPLMAISDLPAAEAFPYPGVPMDPEARPRQIELPTGGDPALDAGQGAVSSGAAGPWAWCRVVGQAGGLFVVLETEDGMVLMDPQAAHERVLFERFMADAGRTVESQGLLGPESVELPPRDAARVRGQLDPLRELGFGISDFGGDAFLVDAVPARLGVMEARDFLAELAGNLEQSGRQKATRTWVREQIALAACRAAVRARKRLTLHEIERLVVDLAGTEMPYTCPHGRPTLIFMSYAELNRKFGRA